MWPFRRKTANRFKKDPDPITRSVYGKGQCPFCDSKDHWTEGPHGGMSVNIFCENCGARFNTMGPFGVDLTHGPTKEGNWNKIKV